MKTLIILTVFLTSTLVKAEAQQGRYCNCYHKDGSSLTTNVSFDSRGNVKNVGWAEEGRLSARPLGYKLVTRAHEVSELITKFIPGTLQTNKVYSVEVFNLVKNPTNLRERNVYNFFDSNGKLVAMVEQKAERIMKCEGSPSGLKSFCSPN